MRWFRGRLHGLRRRTLIVLGALAVAGVVGGVVWATIPDGDGVIHACYSKSGGALRVIDDSVTNCKKGETALSWNQSGPPGEPGAGGGAVYAEFTTGPGGVGAITLGMTPTRTF